MKKIIKSPAVSIILLTALLIMTAVYVSAASGVSDGSKQISLSGEIPVQLDIDYLGTQFEFEVLYDEQGDVIFQVNRADSVSWDFAGNIDGVHSPEVTVESLPESARIVITAEAVFQEVSGRRYETRSASIVFARDSNGEVYYETAITSPYRDEPYITSYVKLSW